MGTTLDHLYRTARWARLRRHQLAEHPWCKICEDHGEPLTVATVVDHVEPHRGDDNKFWLGKLQSLCHACHVGPKHYQELHGYLPGVGLDGYPIDKVNHPAYRKRVYT